MAMAPAPNPSGADQMVGAPMGAPSMDEQQLPQQEEMSGGGANPVVGALQTITAFLAAQREKQNPQAEEMLSAFQQFIQTLGSAGEMEAPPEPMAEGEPPMGGPQPMSPAGEGGQPMSQGSSMNAGGANAARIL